MHRQDVNRRLRSPRKIPEGVARSACAGLWSACSRAHRNSACFVEYTTYRLTTSCLGRSMSDLSICRLLSLSLAGLTQMQCLMPTCPPATDA